MSPPEIILVPTDFGAPSEAALAYAIDLAKPLGARVYLLWACEPPLVGFADGALVPNGDVLGQMMQGGNKALDTAIDKLSGRDVEMTPLVKQGDPREVILSAAKEVGASLIVMGTHGRRGIRRALIGSVTERVVRTSDVPVLTVHGKEGS
jgi:nucleotide-binding universal stress UspA family protein